MGFLNSGLTSAFLWNVLVSIKLLIMSVMGVINMATQFLSTLVGMASRSHDFDDEPKISFLITSSVTRSKTFISDPISVFALMEYSVLYLKIRRRGLSKFSEITSAFNWSFVIILLPLTTQVVLTLVTRTILMCARSAPCSFEIVAKCFTLHYFKSHPWI